MIWYRIPIRPVTKKNSQQIIKSKGRPMIIPSAQYRKYEKDAGCYLIPSEPPIAYPINVKCTYYFHPNKDGSIPKKNPDLVNLIEATNDILVKHRIVADDNCTIIVSHDGSSVIYDSIHDEGTEIEISEKEIPFRTD